MTRSPISASPAVSFPAEWDADAKCPSCWARGMQLFYTVNRIPVQSCVLLSTREAALEYPQHDLRLGFCPECGFIANTVFDASYSDYSADYEETQGFSATFSTFAEGLARQLIDQYDLRGKTALEIGCGKGEFLALMCQLGGCRGIGIDPACRPDRLPAEFASRIELIQDFYGDRHRDLAADVVVCRHTLEHIAPTLQFMRNLRRNIGDSTKTLVFFELPDTMRQLQEGAFWDLYYEHCSYFSPGSLARLFRLVGFELIDLDLGYEGQYILITGKPAAGPTQATFGVEDDLEELRRRVAAFPANCSVAVNKWHDYINENTEAGRRVILWGSGSKSVGFLTTLRITNQVEYVVDINPYRHGKYTPGGGQAIVAPSFLAEYRPDCVIVMNPVYRDEIWQDLCHMGLAPELVAL
jgi:SAM-dependent methyltransferase